MKHYKIYLMLLLAIGFYGQGIAQKEYFVYLQTEDLTPFYIRMDGRTISSTASGYLIVGKLTDNVYPIKLGVLGSEAVQDYGITVAGRDAGYMVKKMGEKGWGIVDLQTNSTQMNMEWSSAVEAALNRQKFLEAEKQQNAAAEAEKAAQANAAAAVVVLDSVAPVVMAANNKPASIAPAITAEQQLADSIAQVIAQKEKELKALQDALALATAAKTVTAAVADSLKADSANAAPKEMARQTQEQAAVVVAATATKQPAKPTEEKKPQFLDMELGADSASAVKKDSAAMVVPATVLVNAAADSLTNNVVPADTMPAKTVIADSVAAAATPTDTVAVATPKTDSLAVPEKNAAPAYVKINRNPCTGVLGRSAIDDLMEKSGKLTDRDEIVALYTLAFKDNCVTTANLRKIAATFASNVTRYQVLEAAYPYTLDYYAFGELGNLLSDAYYINQFKTLIQR